MQCTWTDHSESITSKRKNLLKYGFISKQKKHPYFLWNYYFSSVDKTPNSKAWRFAGKLRDPLHFWKSPIKETFNFRLEWSPSREWIRKEFLNGYVGQRSPRECCTHFVNFTVHGDLWYRTHKMPAASSKPSSQNLETEVQDPVKLLIGALEKKTRNLEKRKVRPLIRMGLMIKVTSLRFPMLCSLYVGYQALMKLGWTGYHTAFWSLHNTWAIYFRTKRCDD